MERAVATTAATTATPASHRGGYACTRQSPFHLARPVQRWLHVPRVRALVDAVVVAGAALLIPAGILLAADAVQALIVERSMGWK